MARRPETPFMTLRIRDPEVAVRPVRDGAAYQLDIVKGGSRTRIELAPAALQTLALECLHLSRSTPADGPRIEDVEEAFKQPALALKAYGPLAVQEVVNHLGIVDLAGFLWYMQDRQLIELFLHELPIADGARLMSELDFYTLFDRADDDTLKIGRRATLLVMQTLQRLTDDETHFQEPLAD